MKLFHSCQVRWVLVLCCLILVMVSCQSIQRSTVSASPISHARPSPSANVFTQVYALSWSPDGNHLATGGKNRKVMVWAVPALTPLVTCQNSSDTVYALAWSPDGKKLS